MSFARRLLLNAAVLALPFASPRGISAMGFRFNAAAPPAGGSATPTATPTATPAPTPTATEEEMIPKSEAQKAYKSRDEAKAGLRLVATQLGIDPAGIRIVPTGDEKSPFKLEGDELTEAAELLQAARAQKLEKQKRSGNWEQREAELNAKHQKDLQTRAQGWESEKATLQTIINEKAVLAEMRSAFAAEGALDADGTGTFDDLIRLNRERVKSDILTDASGKPRLQVTVLSEDGTPALDSKGNPVTVRQLAADFLNKRPHFKAARAPRGPGAGGRMPTMPYQPGQAGAAVGGDAAANFLFGGPRTQ